MNTKITLWLFCSFCYLTCASAQVRADFIIQQPKLQGSVRRLYKATAAVPPGKAPWDAQRATPLSGRITDYDEQGNTLEIQDFASKGMPGFRMVFENDIHGNPLLVKVFSAQNQLTNQIKYYYKPNGNLSEVRFYSEKDTAHPQLYQFSDVGTDLLIKELSDTANTDFLVRNGLLVESKKYNRTGQLQEQTTRTYNASGLPETVVISDGNGKELNRFTYQYVYDEKGNWIKELSLDHRLDQYRLRTQTILYGPKPPVKIPAREALEGVWFGIMGNERFICQNGKAVLDAEQTNMHADVAGYNTTTGAFFIDMGPAAGKHKFLASMEGAVLRLQAPQTGYTYYLQQPGAQSLSLLDQVKKEHALAPGATAEAFSSGSSYGLRRKTGAVLLPPVYEAVEVLSHKNAKVKKAGKWAIFDLEGKQLSAFRFESIQLEAFHFLSCSETNVGLYSAEGQEILPCAYTSIQVMPQKMVLASRRINDKYLYGIYTITGAEVQPLIYSSIELLDESGVEGGYGLLEKDGKRSTVWFNTRFEVIRTFPERVKLKPLGNGLYTIKQSIYMGLIDSTGKDITPVVYGDLTLVSAHLLIVSKGLRFGIIDVRGREVIPCELDKIVREEKGELYTNLLLNQAIALWVNGSSFGYINGYGKLIPPDSTRTYFRRYGLNNFVLENLLRFEYSEKWSRVGNVLNAGQKLGNATVAVSTLDFTGDPKTWLQENYQTTQWKPLPLKAAQGFIFSEIDPEQSYLSDAGRIRHRVFIPVAAQKGALLDFKCQSYFYPQLAQDFFNLLQSVRKY